MTYPEKLTKDEIDGAYRNAILVVAEWSIVAHGQGSSFGFGVQFGTRVPFEGLILGFLNCL